MLAGHLPPHVTSVVADNRGQVVFTLDAPLRASTVNTASVRLFKGARPLPASVSYVAAKKQIIATARSLPANTPYKFRLVASRLKSLKGKPLDGEFNGPTLRSGNGQPGGDLIGLTIPSDQPVARFTTTLGTLDVALFKDQTPLTVQNFLAYANAGKWDGTFFHRSISDFIVQGGGYKLTKAGADLVPEGPAVLNEPRPDEPGNIRGTLAMARVNDLDPDTHDDENSATSQWFFNLADNRATLDAQNGGFTVFGQVTTPAGLKVMDRIAAQKTVPATGVFNELPVLNANKYLNAINNTPPGSTPTVSIQLKDLICVKRLAILNTILPPKVSPAGK